MYAAIADSEPAIQLLLNLSATREQVCTLSEEDTPLSSMILGLFSYRLMVQEGQLSITLLSLVVIEHSSCSLRLELVGHQCMARPMSFATSVTS